MVGVEIVVETRGIGGVDGGNILGVLLQLKPPRHVALRKHAILVRQLELLGGVAGGQPIQLAGLQLIGKPHFHVLRAVNRRTAGNRMSVRLGQSPRIGQHEFWLPSRR